MVFIALRIACDPGLLAGYTAGWYPDRLRVSQRLPEERDLTKSRKRRILLADSVSGLGALAGIGCKHALQET